MTLLLQALALANGRAAGRAEEKESLRVAESGQKTKEQLQTELARLKAELAADVQRAEAGLRASEEQLRLQSAALQAAANAISITDRNGSIQWVNPAFERLTGYHAAELMGRNHRLLKSGKQNARFYKELWDTITAGRVWHGDIVNQRKDGTLYYEEMTVTPVTNTQGEITHFIAIKQDVTARKRAEEALRESEARLAQANATLEGRVAERTAKLQEAMHEMEQMSYSMIHDLRAPLRALQSFGGILEEDPETHLSEQGRELVDRMRTAASRMDHLIVDVLSYSKVVKDELPLGPVDTAKLARGIVATYPDLHPPRAEVHVAPDLPVVLGNEAALTQCLSQLLTNAVKFAKPGQMPRVELKSEAGANGCVRLVVEDNGIGIDPAWKAKVFGMFQRLSYRGEGTGMGLAIVKKATERMGGSVGVESEPAKGSRFWLELRSGLNSGS